MRAADFSILQPTNDKFLTGALYSRDINSNGGGDRLICFPLISCPDKDLSLRQ
ncbi:hypothetical protein [Scytonema sp. HK-05]|uniref:hypothetical protein n=1 Tax=Scytonema sp. HK-05 TaxID=1137095 RepID=UPI001E2E7438|nr:hypothetical protein [Scytonema sp. HK-05]